MGGPSPSTHTHTHKKKQQQQQQQQEENERDKDHLARTRAALLAFLWTQLNTSWLKLEDSDLTAVTKFSIFQGTTKSL